MTGLTMEQMRAALSDSRILSQLSSEAVLPATNLTALLDSVIKETGREAEQREALKASLAKSEGVLGGISSAPISPYQFKQGLDKFTNKAKDVYKRVGTTAASIANGELKAVSQKVMGPLALKDTDANQQMMIKEIAVFNRKGTPKVARLMFVDVLDDLTDALTFLKKEVNLLKDGLRDDHQEFTELMTRADESRIGIRAASDYATKVEGYIAALANVDALEEAISQLKNADNKFPTKTSDASREWAFHTIKGISHFGKFVCQFAAAEADLLDLEGVKAQGPMAKAALDVLRAIIGIDQRLYPFNNQIPMPPIGARRLPDLPAYFDAYVERQDTLSDPGIDRKVINRANAQFDRQMNIATKGYLMMKETGYNYTPAPPAEIFSAMAERGAFTGPRGPPPVVAPKLAVNLPRMVPAEDPIDLEGIAETLEAPLEPQLD